MRSRYSVLSFSAAALLVWGCGGGVPATAGPGGTDGGAAPAPGGLAHDGLPCDMANLLQTNCDSCHSNPPLLGVPVSLVTYADLQAISHADPSKTEAQQSLVRLQSPTTPMPPGTHLAASDIAVLQNWVTAGSPMGSCQAMTPDAGLPNTSAQCTSGITWSGFNGSSMRPGEACIACHTQGEGPNDTIAGTVYPTIHEPNDCNGTSGPTVLITDAAGHSLTLTPNSAGNFSSRMSLTFPIHASVSQGGQTRTMVSSPATGDCNTCHTQNGLNGAPGRIVVP